MLSTLHAPLILLGLLWMTFGVRLYRTYRVGKLNTEFSRFSWLASFFWRSGRDAFGERC